ncbi:MAG: sel1 repeat family protein [Alphaproteobacteria bacterium]|nr:sel1 repeat family protein [Alphaproteobacteria bacterium]
MSTSEADADLERLRQAAAQADADARLSIAAGLLYKAATADEVTDAIAWLRKVAEEDGVTPSLARYAQIYLGTLYWGGERHFIHRHNPALKRLLAPDSQAALKWYRMAADKGSDEASLYIGELYEEGTPATPKNLPEAFQWYTRATRDGTYGIWQLAEMHFHGRGVKRNYVEAARLYRASHSRRAWLRLGWMAENGKGVLQDLAEAHKWFNLASEDDEEAIREEGSAGRTRVEGAMTAAQKSDAWARYETFKDEIRARAGA